MRDSIRPGPSRAMIVSVRKEAPRAGSKASVAYRTYSQKALLRFDLEGQIETNRQQRSGLSLNELSGDLTVTEHVRNILQRERAH